MSNNIQNFPDDAIEVLSREIHDPCFFNKLANDWNIVPRSQEEGTQLLELAAVLRGTHEAQVKTASAPGNTFLTGALDSLKGALSDRGIYAGPTTDVQTIKAAAANAAQNPQVAEAALKYAQHLFATLEN
jgi:hypothetical protein